MRTLARRLALPVVQEQVRDESAWALYLPRRRTRWLYRILAVVIGAAAGFAYARFVLDGSSTLWIIALAALGAVIGYVLVLMPAALVATSRRLGTSLAVRRRASALKRSLERTAKSASHSVEQQQDDRDAWERLGLVSLLRGEGERAVEALDRACEVSSDGNCIVNRSVALAELNSFDDAADLLLQGAATPSTAAVAQHNLGVLISRCPRQAIVDRVLGSLNVVEAAPVLSNLGTIELSQGKLDLAERYLAKAVQDDPAAVAPHANLALVAYRRGRVAEAVEQLHRAAELDPTHPTIANNFGAMLCAAGQPLVAARVLSKAALLAPTSPEIELNRGCIRLNLGQYEDALESFTDPAVHEEYPAIAAHNAALALIALERLEPAREEIERGLQRAPEDPGLLNNLGCLAWVAGDDAEMVAVMSAISDTSEPVAALNLAAARIAAGKPEQALEMLEALREAGNRDPLISFYRGLALLAQSAELYDPKMTKRQREQFFESLYRCLRPFNAVASADTGGSIEAQTNLALYHYLRMDYMAAADAFIAVTKLLPEIGFLQFCAGTALAEEARRVQAEHPGENLAPKARELLKRARKHLEQAVEFGEVTADAFCNLGMCAYDLGDTEGALNAFKRMVQLEDSADSNNNMAIVHARTGQELQHNARAASLISRDRESDMLSRAGTHLSSALHYFVQALEHNQHDPVLHGNIGLAHMLRNRGDDVEAALRHWQRMLALGGANAGKRFEELTALTMGGEDKRAEFDQTLMSFRSLDPRRCMVSVPPQLYGPRQVLLPISEEMDWQFVTDDPVVHDLLRQRDQLAGLRKRLARLSI